MLVNGKPGKAGQQVEPGVDSILVEGRPVLLPKGNLYLMLNKPAGLITTTADERGRRTVMELVGEHAGLFPVGRLDRESRGLLLFTDDGTLAARLLHPRYHVEKEYRVLVSGRPSRDALRRIREGVTLDNERLMPARVSLLRSNPERTRLAMVLKEGRKREVRRIWEALGHPVIDLQRVRLGSLRLGDLPERNVRPLTRGEIGQLRREVGL